MNSKKIILLGLLALTGIPCQGAASDHSAEELIIVRKLKKLLATGVNINETDTQGNTALMEAACRGQSQAVQILLRAGANPRILNRGNSALDLAIKQASIHETDPRSQALDFTKRDLGYTQTIKMLTNCRLVAQLAQGPNKKAPSYVSPSPLCASEAFSEYETSYDYETYSSNQESEASREHEYLSADEAYSQYEYLSQD